MTQVNGMVEYSRYRRQTEPRSTKVSSTERTNFGHKNVTAT